MSNGDDGIIIINAIQKQKPFLVVPENGAAHVRRTPPSRAFSHDYQTGIILIAIVRAYCVPIITIMATTERDDNSEFFHIVIVVDCY